MVDIIGLENGQKKRIHLTADAGAGNPVGTIIPMYKKSSPSGYLYCDGSTFDQTKYPLLYAYLGSNVLPDYRECAIVGAEQNTTDTIAAHDVYTEGQFKDDQGQRIQGAYSFGSISGESYGMGPNSYSGAFTNLAPGYYTKYVVAQIQAGTGGVGVELDSARTTRAGTVTRGKRKAVYFYIKATSGLSENAQDNVVAQLKGLLKTVEYTGTTGGDGMLWGAFSGIDVTKVLSVLVKSDTGHNTSAMISNASSSPTAYGIRIVHFQNNSYTSEANKEVTVSITYLDY